MSVFGFSLLVILSLFASVFATYLALRNKGPAGMEFTAKDLFEITISIRDDNVTVNIFINICVCNVSYEKL